MRKTAPTADHRRDEPIAPRRIRKLYRLFSHRLRACSADAGEQLRGADLKSYAEALYDDLLEFLGNIPTYAVATESVNEAITTYERKQGEIHINKW